MTDLTPGPFPKGKGSLDPGITLDARSPFPLGKGVGGIGPSDDNVAGFGDIERIARPRAQAR